MSRAASAPPTHPPSKEVASKLRALSPLADGEPADAPSPAPAPPAPASSSTAAPPVPEAAPSPAPAPEPDEHEEEEETSGEPKTIVDQTTFDQILELDEDETYDFSTDMVVQYFNQATTTFEEMGAALTTKDLLKLSNLGHFLKGSSAALGVSQVQRSCERIQHYGKLWNEEAQEKLSEEQALGLIEPLLKTVNKEYQDAEKWLRNWYSEKGIDLAAKA